MTAEEVFTHHARSFAPAARLLARPDYDRIARLYALCRTVDDLADETGGPAIAARLTGMSEALSQNDTNDPLAAEARALFDGRPEGLAHFVRLVRTVAADTGETCLADDAALDAYCMGVAGTVGLMVCALYDIPAASHGAAADLGKAMQLTNICRDVISDAVVGRRYLPSTLCPHTPDDIAAGGPAAQDDVRRAVGVLLTRADALYASGRSGLPALPFRLRMAVASAAAMYRGIGQELRRRDCDPSQGRAFVPTWRKVTIAGGEIVRNLLPPGHHSERRHHASP
jgi:15-cis-phytoene synthase